VGAEGTGEGQEDKAGGKDPWGLGQDSGEAALDVKALERRWKSFLEVRWSS
jgi:hypothetical protein